MRIRNYLLALVLISFLSCKKDAALEAEIASIDVDFNVERFDKAFGLANTNDLPQLKSTYPFLFPKRIPDSTWTLRMKDTLQQQMFNEAQNVFGDFNETTLHLSQLFQHLKYYDKTFNLPRVITVADNVDYRVKTIVNNELVIINLVNYLGKNHEFYWEIQQYISQNMVKNQIVPDITDNYAKKYAYQKNRKSLLDEMIYFGKLLYFKDIMIPGFSDAEKIGYSKEDIQWAKINETQIWSYFVEREMLFSSDSKLFPRFTAPAPFSKFYLELDNESPGRLGQYIGWQIVRAYADRTNEDVLSIMQTEPEEIFTKSKYKPKK